MADTESSDHIVTKKIKIQVGQPKASARTQAVSSSSSGNASSRDQTTEIDMTVFGDNGPRTLAEICDSYYGNRYKKRRRKIGNEEEKDINREKGTQIKAPARHEPARPVAKTTGPRVEFVDGKMVIKESSLEIGQDSMYNDDNYVYEEVEESATQSATTYSSFRSKSSSTVWGIEETYLFYQTLRQCGTNFSLMQTFFPGRTRDALKKKFHREEKSHPELVHQYLSNGLPLDLEAFEALFGDKKIKLEVEKLSNDTKVEPVQ